MITVHCRDGHKIQEYSFAFTGKSEGSDMIIRVDNKNGSICSNCCIGCHTPPCDKLYFKEE